MTNEEKLSKMCSIVKEIDQEEEAKEAANKYHNDRLKDRWAELKAVANDDTRQAEMEFKSTAEPAPGGTVVDVTPESADGMKPGTHFEIVGGGRKKLPPAPADKAKKSARPKKKNGKRADAA